MVTQHFKNIHFMCVYIYIFEIDAAVFLIQMISNLIFLNFSKFCKNAKKNHFVLSGKYKVTFYSGTGDWRRFLYKQCNFLCQAFALSCRCQFDRYKKPQSILTLLGPGYLKFCPRNSGSIQVVVCSFGQLPFSFLGNQCEAKNSP